LAGSCRCGGYGAELEAGGVCGGRPHQEQGCGQERGRAQHPHHGEPKVIINVPDPKFLITDPEGFQIRILT